MDCYRKYSSCDGVKECDPLYWAMVVVPTNFIGYHHPYRSYFQSPLEKQNMKYSKSKFILTVSYLLKLFLWFPTWNNMVSEHSSVQFSRHILAFGTWLVPGCSVIKSDYGKSFFIKIPPCLPILQFYFSPNPCPIHINICIPFPRETAGIWMVKAQRLYHMNWMSHGFCLFVLFIAHKDWKFRQYIWFPSLRWG